MSFHNLLSKCDRALAAYVIGGGAGTTDNTFPAKRSEGKTLPCIICECRTMTPVGYPGTGTYEVSATVTVRTAGVAESEFENTAEVPADDSDALVSDVFDLFHLGTTGDDLAEAITTAGRNVGGDMDAFTVTSAMISEIERGSSAKGDAWVDRLHLKLIACPANVS